MAGKKPLKDAAKSNPTALGDPVSLKAELSDTSPTEEDRGEQSAQEGAAPRGLRQSACNSKSLKERAEQDLNDAKKGNRSMLGDPVSLKAEKADDDPIRDADENEDGTGRSGGARNKKGRDSKL